MSRNTEELGGLSLLGNQHTEYRADYAPEVLEAFPNKHPTSPANAGVQIEPQTLRG